MGIIELIIAIVIFLLLANIFLSFVPIPRGIAGVLVALLLIYLAYVIVF